MNREEYVLNRVIAEVFAFEGNPHPLAEFLAMTEPESENARYWVEMSGELAELLPDSRSLSRNSLPCVVSRAPKPPRRRKRRCARRRRAKRQAKKW